MSAVRTRLRFLGFFQDQRRGFAVVLEHEDQYPRRVAGARAACQQQMIRPCRLQRAQGGRQNALLQALDGENHGQAAGGVQGFAQA